MTDRRRACDLVKRFWRLLAAGCEPLAVATVLRRLREAHGKLPPADLDYVARLDDRCSDAFAARQWEGECGR
jgi:hypothetical protein